MLLDGLSKLEYRGYDSAGIAVRDGQNEPSIVKAKGRLSVLSDKTDGGKSVPGTSGIGHTRWATHGEPTETNAHPHASDDINVIAVHNGIIENFQELKDKLLRHDYKFHSETDTEVVVKLIDYYYKKYNIGPIDAIAKTMVRVRGSYALAVMFKDYPGEIYAARKDSPMILGVGESENFIASDVTAILQYTRKVIYVDNYEMARITPDVAEVYNLNGDVTEKPVTEVTWDTEAAEKGGFEHFMIKEIHEQPKVIKDTINSVVKENDGKYEIDLSACGLSDEEISKYKMIWIVGCGSAYHVGVCAQYVIEDLAQIPVRVELASEFRYRKLGITQDDLVIVISQSGETADSLAALRKANDMNVTTLGIVNVVGSSIAREATHCFYTLAGPEIAVATTKAYSCQLIACDILALGFARALGKISDEDFQNLLAEMTSLPDKIEKIIEDKERIQWFASKFAHAQAAFVIGRGLDYGIAMEGSLKMKEISYIHSEAYAAGELKHGTISLIEPDTLVIGITTQPELIEKTVSNMAETRARGAYLCGITFNGNYFIEDRADFVTYIPKTDPHFAASLAVIPLQLLSYYMSVNRGLDVDKPRNLAKSVTVE